MIKRSLPMALCIASTILAASSAMAADGTITFTGKVLDNSCTIAGGGGGTANFAVNLPNVNKTALASAGAFAGATPFQIQLSNCESTKVSTLFEMGPNVDVNTGDLKNTAPSGASNVQVRITNGDDDSPINIAQASQGSHKVDIDSTSKKAILKYYAKYIATGAASAGNVDTTVMYSMIYE
ncbi:fimbrial protein [Dyella choica]|uniref:Type 1 fimbrial protein n=1 Tax=Dyella choica TaxID=1927959 RepID=A0A3S0Q646_9GAMM|nr:fimbrial protein [Dyella choica]RUL78239.1 type 1 fimbrial protein [Dyella choica]